MGKKDKQKKKRNKKRNRYTTGNRVDMRTGGRVKAQVGGIPVGGVQPKPKKPITTPDPNPPVKGGPVGDPVPFDNTTNPPEGDLIGDPIDKDGFVPDPQEDTSGQSQSAVSSTNQGQTDPNREDRTVRTGERAEQIAQGKVGDIPQIPIPATIGRDKTDIATGTGRMEGEVEDVSKQQIDVSTEDVSTGKVATGTVENQLTANTFDAITKNQPNNVAAAIRELDDDLKQRITARVQEIAERNPTEAANVAEEELRKVLTDEVIGELGPLSTIPFLKPKTAIELEQVEDAKAQERQAQQIDADVKMPIIHFNLSDD